MKASKNPRGVDRRHQASERPDPTLAMALAATLMVTTACRGAPPRASVAVPREEPPGFRAATDSEWQACLAAPMLRSRSEVDAATSKRQPLVAVRVEVRGGEREFATGDGQLGLRGFRQNHSATVVNMATRRVEAEVMTGVCFDNYLSLPEPPGVYCIVLAPGAPNRTSTFSLDFEARIHYRAIASAYDEVEDARPGAGAPPDD